MYGKAGFRVGAAQSACTGSDLIAHAEGAEMLDWGEESAGMLELAARLKEALRPRSPLVAFRQGLRQDLLRMAEGRAAQDVRIAPAQPNTWIIGAAIGSVITLAGAIAYLLHSHEQASRQSSQVRT